MRRGIPARNIISADSKEFGNSRARSNPRARIRREIRAQSPRLEGFGSLQTLSTKGAAVNRPATHARTRTVISASGKCCRTAFMPGMARTASPTQLGPRMRIFFIYLIQNQPHQVVEVRNLSRDTDRAEWAAGEALQPNGVLFSGHQNPAGKLLDFTRGVMVMIGKADSLYRPEAYRFHRSKEPLRLGDSSKSYHRAAVQLFRRNEDPVLINAFKLRLHSKHWYRQVGHRSSRHILYTCGMCPRNGRFRFAPRAGRQQSLARCPFGGIDRHDIHIPVQLAVLKPVIQKKDVSQLLFLGVQARLIPVRCDNDRDILQPLLHQHRFVAALFPIHAGNDNAAARSSITSRENDWPEPSAAQAFGDRNNQRCLACPSDGEISDADHRVVQTACRQDSRFIQLCTGLYQQPESAAQRLAPTGSRTCRTRSVAPVFCSTTARAFFPISHAFWRFVMSSATAAAS